MEYVLSVFLLKTGIQTGILFYRSDQITIFRNTYT